MVHAADGSRSVNSQHSYANRPLKARVSIPQAGDNEACTAWVTYDQAAMGLGAVVVPLYTQDRPENVAYIIKDSGAKVLLLESAEQWRAFEPVREQLGGLVRVLLMKRPQGGTGDERVLYVERWLPEAATEVEHVNADPMQLASIVYTSGTTGRPKGVMLSHNNMLTNAHAATFKMAVDVIAGMPLQALQCASHDVQPEYRDASHAWMTLDGRDPFREHSLANAKMLMRQGAGRLIRNDGDRGIIAILDPRVRTKNYGEAILENLPRGMRTFTDIYDAIAAVGIEP